MIPISFLDFVTISTVIVSPMAAHRGARGDDVPPEVDPTYPQVIHKDEEQRVRFQKLKYRMFVPTRFVNRYLLYALRITEISRTLFRACIIDLTLI